MYLKIITDKYDVVVSNPPYTDNRAYSGTELGKFLGENYKTPFNFSQNLYACFYKRGFDLLTDFGYLGIIHPLTFMYIATYEDMRKHMINYTSVEVFVDYGLSDLFGTTLVDPAFYVLKKGGNNHIVPFISLDKYTRTSYEKRKKEFCLSASSNIYEKTEDKNVIYMNPEDFKNIEGYPFIYDISSEFRKKFMTNSIEKEGIKVATGLATGDNARFLRLWWEVFYDINQIDGNSKWVHYSKGGPYCKWYGNRWALVNWENNGYEIKHFVDENGKQRSATRNERLYDKEGITFSGASTKGTTFRVLKEKEIFDVKGSSIFPADSFNNLEYLIGFLNTRLVFYIADLLNPTVSTQVGDINRVPFIVPTEESEKTISEYSRICIEAKKEIDENYYLNGAAKSPLSIYSTVTSALRDVIADELERNITIFVNEYLIDKRVIDIYSLNEADIKRLEDKMGVCVASIPVYSKAKDLYIESGDRGEKERDALMDIESIELNALLIDKLKSKIKTVLFSNNNEMEDFCRNNEINPITIWYFVKSDGLLPQIKAKELIFDWFVFALRDILNEHQDGILGFTDTDTSIVHVLEEYADKKGITSAQLLQMEEFLGKKIRDFMEKDFLSSLWTIRMYLCIFLRLRLSGICHREKTEDLKHLFRYINGMRIPYTN